MPPLQRQQQIVSLLEQQQHCAVEELTGRFGVSDMTIRRDLEHLAEQGRIIRTHGGAAAAPRVSFEFEFLQRAQTEQPAKQAIGQCAAGLVDDGQSVVIDSGTTTLAVARALRQRQNLTVITSSLPIASVLQFCRSFTVILLGGQLRGDSPDLAGGLTESNLETLHTDLAVIGADGIDLHGSIYHGSPELARLVAKMTAAADTVYVVADHTKIGRRGLCRSADLRKCAGLVTDRGLGRTERMKLKKAGVEVMVAE